MESFQTFVMLMFAAAILVGIAQKIHIPYPITLVLGGTAIGFAPFIQGVSFDPNLILLIVLPPLLYYAAFGISFRVFKRNLSEIISLALGLVILTTCVIAVLFKWIFPEFPWALAFAFGAIISPPDAIAASTILKRLTINTRLVTILEGESLVNDASALVLYRLAVVALLSGTFSFSEASMEFVIKVVGGIAVGGILGYLIQNFSSRYLEPVVGVVFSFTIPYITFILADALGVSGVLAVVVNGLIGSKILIRHHLPLRRVLGYAAWDIFNILMNCFVFILIGLQLRTLISLMTAQQIILYISYAAIITLAMILVRMVWVFAKSAFTYYTNITPIQRYVKRQIFREAAIVGWSGMRGIVSLAAALALPLTLPNGMPLEGRNEVIFITFVVILLTLLIPGLTLPYFIRRLKIHTQSEQHQLPGIRRHLAEVAEETIKDVHASKGITDEEFDYLQGYITLQSKVLTASIDKQSQNLESVRSKIIQEKRKKLFELWEQLEITDKVLIQLEHELDLEETHIARAELR